MNLQQAIEILTSHNNWRRKGDGEMIAPKLIGEAIDFAIEYMMKDTFNLISNFYMIPKNGGNPLKIETSKAMTKKEVYDTAMQVAKDVNRAIEDFEIKYHDR